MAEEPVRDFTTGPETTLTELLERFGTAGGFTAAKLATAAGIMRRMHDSDCTVFLSFPADIMATGTRGVLRQLVSNGFIDVIVTTCGTLDHDIARTLANYYHGDFEMNDTELRERGINRLGNVLVPDDSYGIPIEKWMQSFLEDLYKKQTRWIPREIWHELGARLAREERGNESLLAACVAQNVPVFVPGFSDGAVGSQLWQFWQSHRDFTPDTLADEHALSDIVHDAKATGALMIGGGISKHHVIWWNQFRDGLDYAIQVTTAPEWDGSLSGARIREAVSWGKVRPEAQRVTVEGDATVLLPLLAGALR
ncbi:MAG: deoxyhypusine synthase [Candidatus Poseidoniia archaeon]|jgi:deoxyhypusine synthase|nr:deoxyhypusine synthase [Candidatus Poseidoniia archaeon]|tara:strand:- start:326 stop:1255 length:930 start_codon:yes stop_codon:yes gene_type:complete